MDPSKKKKTIRFGIMNVNRVIRIHVLVLSLFVSCCIDARDVTSGNGNEVLIQALETINQNIRVPETPREKENLKSALLNLRGVLGQLLSCQCCSNVQCLCCQNHASEHSSLLSIHDAEAFSPIDQDPTVTSKDTQKVQRENEQRGIEESENHYEEQGSKTEQIVNKKIEEEENEEEVNK